MTELQRYRQLQNEFRRNAEQFASHPQDVQAWTNMMDIRPHLLAAEEAAERAAGYAKV